MRNWNNGDNWDFGRWLRNTARNAKANIAVNSLPEEELAIYRSVINYFCRIEEEQSSSSGSEETERTGIYTVGGTRPWLYQRLVDKSVSGATGYRFDTEVEPGYAIVRALEVVAHDIVSIPLSAEENDYLKTLDFMPINGTNHAEGDEMHRALGAQPGFGGVVGSREGTNTVPRETTFHFDGSPDETYLIEGTLDDSKMTELGLLDEYQETWIKQPTSVEIGSAVTSIGSGAFSGCSSVTSVTIPNSVTSIGGSAFSGCYNLMSVTIPNSVTSIGGSAFQWCESLASITIPDSVTSIAASAFQNCSGLASVTIGNGVTSIGDTAFMSCTNLTSVTIGSGVTSIGNYAFMECSSLTSVIMSGKTKATVQGMSNYSWGLHGGCVIHCTDGDITVEVE